MPYDEGYNEAGSVSDSTATSNEPMIDSSGNLEMPEALSGLMDELDLDNMGYLGIVKETDANAPVLMNALENSTDYMASIDESREKMDLYLNQGGPEGQAGIQARENLNDASTGFFGWIADITETIRLPSSLIVRDDTNIYSQVRTIYQDDGSKVYAVAAREIYVNDPAEFFRHNPIDGTRSGFFQVGEDITNATASGVTIDNYTELCTTDEILEFDRYKAAMEAVLSDETMYADVGVSEVEKNIEYVVLNDEYIPSWEDGGDSVDYAITDPMELYASRCQDLMENYGMPPEMASLQTLMEMNGSPTDEIVARLEQFERFTYTHEIVTEDVVKIFALAMNGELTADAVADIYSKDMEMITPGEAMQDVLNETMGKETAAEETQETEAQPAVSPEHADIAEQAMTTDDTDTTVSETTTDVPEENASTTDGYATTDSRVGTAQESAQTNATNDGVRYGNMVLADGTQINYEVDSHGTGAAVDSNGTRYQWMMNEHGDGSAVSSDGKSMQFSIDENGTANIVDSDGKTTHVEFNGHDGLAVDSDGNRTQFSVDENGNVSAVTANERDVEVDKEPSLGELSGGVASESIDDSVETSHSNGVSETGNDATARAFTGLVDGVESMSVGADVDAGTSGATESFSENGDFSLGQAAGLTGSLSESVSVGLDATENAADDVVMATDEEVDTAIDNFFDRSETLSDSLSEKYDTERIVQRAMQRVADEKDMSANTVQAYVDMLSSVAEESDTGVSGVIEVIDALPEDVKEAAAPVIDAYTTTVEAEVEANAPEGVSCEMDGQDFATIDGQNDVDVQAVQNDVAAESKVDIDFNTPQDTSLDVPDFGTNDNNLDDVTSDSSSNLSFDDLVSSSTANDTSLTDEATKFDIDTTEMGW